jgi:penicillin-binding protein 1A
MVPHMQDAAAESLREGLAKFDGGRGWRDLELSVDPSGDWAGELDRTPVGVGFSDWRKAVVLSKSGNQAEIGFTNGTKGVLPASAAQQPKRSVGGSAFSHLKPGMVIIVKQLGTESYALRSVPEVGGGFVAEEVATGRVLAMQGGFDVIGSDFNRATQALRQPGSAFKPIVYQAALENGFTPASIIVDAPFCVWQGAGLGNKCFVNFDRRYSGAKTLRWGVEQSRNLMTVRAASQVGMQKVVDNAKKLGVGDYEPYLSMSLGAGDTTVLRLTNAYAILANHGREVKPTLIDLVQDRNGKVIYRADNRCAVMEGACNAPDWNGKAMPRPPVRAKQLLEPMAAFQMVHVLTGVVERGTATSLRDLNRPMFGKTGTTSGPTNVWFVGGTPEIVAGVYIGYDQPRAMGHGAQGGRIAAPIFKQFAQKAFAGMPVVPFVAPSGIRWVRVERGSGRRVFGTFPTREDPKSAVIWEAFQPQTEPRRSFRRSGGQDDEDADAAAAARQAKASRPVKRPRPPRAAERRQSAPLPT